MKKGMMGNTGASGTTMRGIESRPGRGASGLLSFSRVGFDHKKNQALVFISDMKGHSSGRQWGDGSYVLLIKKKGRWRVQGRVGLIVS